MPKLTHWTDTDPAHDCIAIPCKWGLQTCIDGTNGHGIGAARMRWLVTGAVMPDGRLGAVQFLVSTAWYLDETYDRMKADGELTETLSAILFRPMATDLGYHSPYPTYQGMDPMSGECIYIGGRCYYDGSGLNAEQPFDILRSQGDDALWPYLDSYWHDTFDK